MFVICADHLKYIHKYTYLWGACEVHVRCMWGACEVHVRCMWGACEGHVRCMWGACEMHVRYMWGICEEHVRCNAIHNSHKIYTLPVTKTNIFISFLQKRGFPLKFMLESLKADSQYDAGTTSVASIMSITGKTIVSLLKFYFWC